MWGNQKSLYCHITPVLAGLHWLPVRHRINYKSITNLPWLFPRYCTAAFVLAQMTLLWPYSLFYDLYELFYDIFTIEKNINGHFKIFFINCISCLESAAHPCFFCLDIACFHKASQDILSLMAWINLIWFEKVWINLINKKITKISLKWANRRRNDEETTFFLNVFFNLKKKHFHF